MKLSKYSMGVGDRFGRQGVAQLTAFVQAKAMGVDITPVWNKSNREHLIVHSEPPSVRVEADGAVTALGWQGPYFVDADHIVTDRGQRCGRDQADVPGTDDDDSHPISLAGLNT